MALRQLALNLQQEISTGGDLHNVRERLDGLSSGELQELCSFRVDGRTLVATIAATNKWDLLDYLINQGVKVHEVDETILHFAVVQKADNIVKLLIKSGIDVNYARDDGKTPLHVASEYGLTDTVQFLLENGAKKSMAMTERSGCTPLTLAAMTGQTPVMSELIKHGANINVTSGFPPLHAAALLGHINIIKLLLENKADVNLIDAAKALAIHYATMKNHRNVIQELIKSGSNLKTKDSRGNLPLNLAKSKEVKQMIRKAMGLDVEEPGDQVNSPMASGSRLNTTNSVPTSPVLVKPVNTVRQDMHQSISNEPETGETDHYKKKPEPESARVDDGPTLDAHKVKSDEEENPSSVQEDEEILSNQDVGKDDEDQQEEAIGTVNKSEPDLLQDEDEVKEISQEIHDSDHEIIVTQHNGKKNENNKKAKKKKVPTATLR